MNLQWFSVQVISGVLLVVLSNVYCDGSIENDRIGIYSRKSPVYLIKSPLHRMYLEWLAENLGNREKMNSGEEQIFSGLMEKRDKFSNFPALEAYFIYKVNRDNCINLGDEGCVNGALPGAGSDSGFLNGGNNPGK
ncbi:unnamed protein product [Hermetia illucens]|uniref:Uncharacterized protein n=1 Tax=Hermetia illucens TaxID=343691 RepID=A0A7R8V361_HERIL|nr:uncharacterized protein LOC119660499 [Hermetia illucens]CAD7092011.1 unnamed protein product [Hermetia illucens]